MPLLILENSAQTQRKVEQLHQDSIQRRFDKVKRLNIKFMIMCAQCNLLATRYYKHHAPSFARCKQPRCTSG